MAGKKGKLPKKIGGVKLPKAVRKQARRAIAELGQPIVRDGIAAALGMAAAAMARQADRMREERAAKAAATPSKAAGADQASAAPAGAPGGGQLAELATGLALAALGRWMDKAGPKADSPTAAAEPERK